MKRWPEKQISRSSIKIKNTYYNFWNDFHVSFKNRTPFGVSNTAGSGAVR